VKYIEIIFLKKNISGEVNTRLVLAKSEPLSLHITNEAFRLPKQKPELISEHQDFIIVTVP